MKIALLVFVLCAALCDAHLGPRRGDRGDRPGGHHRGPPPPPYLDDVTEEARREYFTIVSMDKTIAAQKQEILDWGQKYGIQDKVEEFNEKMESFRNEVKKNVTELIAALPLALEQFSAIRENEDLTRSQQHEALRELKAANPKVHDVLRFTFHLFKPRHPHGKPGQHGMGGFGRQGGFGRPGGMSGEFRGEDMIGRPRGRGAFGGFGGRPGFGGFQGNRDGFASGEDFSE